MQLRFLTIPLLGGEPAAEELNRFLAAQRILAVDRHLAHDGGSSVWAVCVSYEPAGESRPPPSKRGKIDYREILNEADFTATTTSVSVLPELTHGVDAPHLNRPSSGAALFLGRNPKPSCVLVAHAEAGRTLAGRALRGG